jgi:hypothetical protein
MTIRLADSVWAKELTDALKADTSEPKTICPFIKATALDRLLSKYPRWIQVITRFSLCDFAEGISEIDALRRSVVRGTNIRGAGTLRAKLYLFSKGRAIVTCANLAEAAIN